MMKYLPFIFAAICIDAMQMALQWAFLAFGTVLTSITPIGGALTGAAVGALSCWNSSGGVISGIIDAVKCGAAGGTMGATLSAVGIPLGAGMGMAADFCISVTFGTMLVLALWNFGMFYPKYILSGGLFEMVPGFDALPGWTAMTIACVLRKIADERKLASKASTAFATIVAPNTTVGTAYRGIKTLQRKNIATMRDAGLVSDERIKADRVQTRQRLTQDLKDIDGVNLRPNTATGVRARTTYAV